MKIAQIAPLYETVPPTRYGGTERVIDALVEELTRRGHEVTLFAAAGTETNGELCVSAPGPLRSVFSRQDLIEVAPHMHLAMLAEAYSRAREFDVIHAHTDIWTFPFVASVDTPTIVTMHGRLDLRSVRQLVSMYPRVPLASISDSQRRPLLDLRVNWIDTVYNGLNFDHYRNAPREGDYLAFVGRLTPEKRPDRAVEVAVKSGLPLRVAAKVDPMDVEYYESVIAPLFERYDVDFVGEISEDEKPAFFGGAVATLMPIDWPEPFGLVMTESMAAGTPVIATDHGSVPEVIEHGISGFICVDVEEMVSAVGRVDEIDSNACRSRGRFFDQRRMADGYVDCYRRLRRFHRAA